MFQCLSYSLHFVCSCSHACKKDSKAEEGDGWGTTIALLLLLLSVMLRYIAPIL